MTRETIQKLLDMGESFTIEYKKNKNRLSSDVYETVCSFGNRYGGHILLGVTEVERDGRRVGNVTGVDKNEVYNMRRDFINNLNNPNMFRPSLYLELEEFDYDGKTVLWTYVPPTSSLCFFNKKVFDRNGDADQDITDKTDRIAEMISRKSSEYREQMILPYANETHLKLELMNHVRDLAKENNRERHPWLDMDDMEILRSAGLYTENISTGEKGFNLAAILLFGKPEVIKSVVPGYMTDAIYRVENIDRYDDRDIVDVNLIEAYDRLMSFCLKHMDNRHVLEDDISIDARVRIAREVVSNILIHRDYTNAFPAKLIIDREALHTENWSKARFTGRLTMESFSPYPKNPLLASFFVNIGRADTLGSGMRNLYKYTRLYSHAEPILTEGDVFKIWIPLNRDANINANGGNRDVNVGKNGVNDDANTQENDLKLSDRILEIMDDNNRITQTELANELKVSKRTIQRMTDTLKKQGKLERVGGTRGYWIVKRM